MADSYRTTKARAAKADKSPTEYERVRRELVAKYNSLLADARSRLQAAIQRVEQGRMNADADGGLELTRKIQELIDYLDQASL